jgi:succinoglycan biosynthesis transport protein ExoP
MDETNNLVPRERPAGVAGDSLQNRSPFLALDLMPREPHLLDYLILLRKHQWLILFFLLATVSIVTIATFRMQPVYQATARVEIDRENSNAIHFSDSDSYGMYEDLENYITTQSKILQSETLAMLTIKSMGLDNMPEFGGNPAKPVKPSAPGSEASLHRPPALGAFLVGMTIKRVPNSRLLDVTFESTDPALAARVVNAHLKNFIEENFRSRYEAATQASIWLAGQLNEMKIKVENAEDARLAYERQNQIWTIDEKSDISSQKLADLNKQLTDAQADRINKEAVYQLAQAGNYDAISAVRESVVIQDILKQESTLSAQYTDALNQYGPKFPKVVRLQAQLKDLDQLVGREKTISPTRWRRSITVRVSGNFC